MPPSNRKAGAVDTCDSTDKSQNNCAEEKQLKKKSFILYEFIYLKY